MSHTIELKDLLVYSNIYGLNLTDQDKIHLEAVSLLYSGKCEATYIYKPTSKSFDLCLQFNFGTNNSTNQRVTLWPTDKIAVQHGYPMFNINGTYLKALPPVADLAYLHQLTKEFHNAGFFNTIDEVKAKFLTTVLPGRSNRNLGEDFIRACFWAQGTLGSSKAQILSTDRKDYASLPNYIRRIIAVLQTADDTRFAFYGFKAGYGGWNPGYDFHIGMYITKPGDPVYNFTDMGHYFSHPDDRNIPRVVYTDQTMTFPKEEQIIAGYRQGKAFLTLDGPTVDTLTRRWMRKQQEAAAEQDAIKKLESKIKLKIEELRKNSTFTYNDMTFDKSSFTYENQTITDSNVDMTQVLGQFYGNYSEEHLNFDSVFDVWLEQVINELKKKKSSKGKIGDVNYELTLKTSSSISKTTGRPINTNSFYINGNKINRDEVVEVLKRALCFPDTTEFEAFCESVSACSLEYHKLVAGGILISAHDEIFDEKLEFKINLERSKRRNYITVGTKKWLIHNTTRLLTVSKAGSMAKVISVLLDPDVAGLSGEEIKSLMDTGKAALIEQRNRDQELLKGTMEMFGIEKVDEVACTNGKVLSGYLVHGKLRDYIVEESKCMVFEHPTGRYLCMVDKGQNEHTNVSRLVNRFFALSNDSKLATEITTL